MRFTKDLIAEFLGTFALIFIGAGAATVLAPNETAAVALAHGFVIMVFAYAFGNESGSYINPALSVAAFVAGEQAPVKFIPVILAQLAGGIAGGFGLLLIYGHGAPHHLGMTTIDPHWTSLAGGFALEAAGTFFLATAVLNTAIRGTAGRMAPFAIGMSVAFAIMAFGPVTGASLNPARTLGPAVAMGNYTQVELYIGAQLTGAVLAALLYRFAFKQSGAGNVLDSVAGDAEEVEVPARSADVRRG